MGVSAKVRFWILVCIVAISGFSQGMLLPLIAIIFEQDGVSSAMNGIHATGIYIGILIASPLMEAPLRKYGYKPLIVVGGFIVGLSLLFFPLWPHFWFWFVLRLLIGVGDQMLHFSTQTWITSSSSAERRGRNIAIYGLFFSLGFAMGPAMSSLVEINRSLPFIVSGVLTFITWGFVFLLRNDIPDHGEVGTASLFGTLKRFKQVGKYAWVAFLPPLSYGFLEASLHGNFPIYALRSGVEASAVAFILPAFSIGAIVFQLPLGILSDKFGRHRVLMTVLFTGAVCFIGSGLAGTSALWLFVTFFLAGMAVGSTFSLGISYMTDLLPKSLLPAGNIMCGIAFSLGSISGPALGGIIIQFFAGGFFYLISTLLFAVCLCLMVFSLVQKNKAMTAET
ncbi:MFS transporter [Jeotgalibacillus proteolyticus]|uniref:MFS transporter n=1 Tax=Jeotgalibacillus proteolyticus TaxID=2082395 RepID=A0A2S5G7C7_9BACL|nr:MFS transporter [Jeotgalibacillus proteolyticus]PPA68853.1 MFS transporter [Jeotgalibacillus proteolyticus]